MSDLKDVTIDDIDWTSLEDEETLLAVIDGLHVEATFFGTFWRVSTRKRVFGDGFCSELSSDVRFADTAKISESARKCLANVHRAEAALEAAGLINNQG